MALGGERNAVCLADVDRRDIFTKGIYGFIRFEQSLGSEGCGYWADQVEY